MKTKVIPDKILIRILCDMETGDRHTGASLPRRKHALFNFMLIVITILCITLFCVLNDEYTRGIC